MVANERGKLLGKMKQQVKICQRGLDLALQHRTMMEYFIVSDAKHVEYKQKMLVQEARNQDNDKRLNDLIKEYQRIEFL